MCDENNIDHVEDYSLIGYPNHVDLYLSYDIKSECAVIGLNNAKDFEIEEQRKVLEVLDNYNIYNFVGSVLKVDDKIVGFSIGEIVGDTLFVHIEKANNTIKVSIAQMA